MRTSLPCWFHAAHVVVLLLLSPAANAQPWWGDALAIRHRAEGPATLSGLVLYGMDGTSGVIIDPGNPDNDATITHEWSSFGGGNFIFAFLTAEYSPLFPGVERETIVRPSPSGGIPYYQLNVVGVPGSPAAVALQLDGTSGPPFAFEAGTLLDAVGGEVFHMGVPVSGWFVGTSVDRVAGEVRDPYTGPLVVEAWTFEAIPYIPSPGTLTLAGAGVLVFRRRRARPHLPGRPGGWPRGV